MFAHTKHEPLADQLDAMPVGCAPAPRMDLFQATQAHPDQYYCRPCAVYRELETAWMYGQSAPSIVGRWEKSRHLDKCCRIEECAEVRDAEVGE